MMQLVTNHAAAWACVLAGAALHALLLARGFKRRGAALTPRNVLLVCLLPACMMLALSKAAYLLLRFGEGSGVFPWCFTAGLAGLMLGTALCAALCGQPVLSMLDEAAPGLCAAMALARLSQRYLGDVGIGCYLEEGSLLCRPPFVLLDLWQEPYLAVFLPEALFAAAALLPVLPVLRRGRHVPGAAVCWALCLLTIPQILLEQFRNGSFLHWRLLRVEQVLCAVLALSALCFLCRRLCRTQQVPFLRAAWPAAAFTAPVLVIAAMQFSLDGKLLDLPEAVCWTLYTLSILAMLCLSAISVRRVLKRA